MRRNEYIGVFGVATKLRSGLILFWKWNGKRYMPDHVIKGKPIITKMVDFRISKLDREKINEMEREILNK